MIGIDAAAFTPKWASPPGQTIKHALREKKITYEDFARTLNVDVEYVNRLILGSESITLGVARKLASSIGSTPEFWMTRDLQYQDSLDILRNNEWVSRLPISQMVKQGWIRNPVDWKDRLSTCLDYFGVQDINEWDQRYGGKLQALFRASSAFEKDAGAVSAWLRQGEILAAATDVAAWNPATFQNSLQEARSLSKWPDPARFIPRLTALCAESGVSLVFLKAPAGCPVSGVTYLVEGKPSILLSARHLTDDHLWFTFFHEAAHVLLHDPSRIYIDTDDPSVSNPAEEEANRFAEEILVPPGSSIRTGRYINAREVVQIANKLGISPGIVVGQLQNSNKIDHGNLNHLKRRYAWKDATLGKA